MPNPFERRVPPGTPAPHIIDKNERVRRERERQRDDQRPRIQPEIGDPRPYYPPREDQPHNEDAEEDPDRGIANIDFNLN